LAPEGAPFKPRLGGAFDLPVRPFVGLFSGPAPKSPALAEVGMGRLVETMLFPLFSVA